MNNASIGVPCVSVADYNRKCGPLAKSGVPGVAGPTLNLTLTQVAPHLAGTNPRGSAPDPDLVREAPRFGPLSFAPVSAKELKKRAFQGIL